MTPKPPSVRLARDGDQELLFALICASDAEWSMGPRDDGKVRQVVHLATSSGSPPRPVFGVVRGASIIEGAVGLYPTEPWNSSEPYLRAFFHFVHPDHRKSHHAIYLRDFAKWFGDMAGLPVVFELLHPHRTEAKARMYERGATRIGGLFAHGVVAAKQAAA
jgi:hypothetical protein